MWNALILPALRGCGQMLFQPSARTGSVFLVLILSQSTASFLACLAGILGATLCSLKLEHPRPSHAEGEGGFNGGLLGLALSVFCEYSGALILVAFAGGAATCVVRAALLKLLPVPPFTMPFVLVAWPAVFMCGGLPGPDIPGMQTMQDGQGHALLTNASQVLFMANPLVGAFMYLAVWLHSRAAAVRIGAASLMAWLTLLLFSMPAGMGEAGLLGYNAMILAAALHHRGTRPLLFATGVVTSVWATYLFFEAGVMPLSLPFVLSAWLIIAAEAVADGRFRQGGG